MADNTVHQIISAYSTGCLDKDNFIQFVSYMKGGGELPKGELGELQNVTSLIPTLLELEDAPPDLKNQVAKRIIDLEAERKEKIRRTEEEKAVPEIKSEQTENRDEAVEDKQSVETEAEQAEAVEDRFAAAEPQKKIMSLPWLLAGVIGLMLLFVTVYFLFINDDLKEEIADINNRLQGYQNEVVQTNKFINDHIELIEFLNYKNVEVVNLLPTENTPDAFGKLFISLDVGEAILQLKNLPKITSREAYQLWMVNESQSFSLGTVFPAPGVEYYKIKNLPSLDKKDIMMFRITKEVRGGSETPQGPLYLFGAFYPDTGEESPSSRRR